MSLNKLVQFDQTLPDFKKQVNDLVKDGKRMLSLSMYGDPEAPLFAAVWDKRPANILPLKVVLALSVPDFKKKYKDHIADSFFPVLVSATGGGTKAKMSGVFEKSNAAFSVNTEMTFNQSLDDFNAEVFKRADKEWIFTNATIYDDVASGALVSAIWEKNLHNTAWIAFAGLDETQHNIHFKVESGAWARLAFVTASTQHRFLAFYRDDQIAEIGKGYAQEFYSNTDDFKAKRLQWVKDGFFHRYFQGFGISPKQRYVALYVVNDKPIARKERITGSPAVTAIDQAVLELMKASNIRGAALAIVKGTKLVLARGYTWAEPDYPDVTPTTIFRLGSTSKMIAALSIHQLVAEGKVKLSDHIEPLLKLKLPNGNEPDHSAPELQPYLTATVGGLLESTCKINVDYPRANEAIVSAAGEEGNVPANLEQIASWIITQPARAAESSGPNDGAFFLAVELVKKVRKLKGFEEVFQPRILDPLSISRIKIADSLLEDQTPDDARHHSRELKVVRSIMSPDRPLVAYGYGEDNLRTMAASGGFAAAALDYARVLAALNSKPYTPLGRTAVDSLLDSAIASKSGHGFDAFNVTVGTKGGALTVAQSGIYFEIDGLSYVMLWNGQHYGKSLRTSNNTLNFSWWPHFVDVLTPAKAEAWANDDLFPTLDVAMQSFPDSQDGWRRCSKCHSLFLEGNTAGACAAGEKHMKGINVGGTGNYQLMVNSKLDYGQKNWRRCVKCRCLFFNGKTKGKCAGGGVHDLGTSFNYSLVVNSAYKEHSQNWRWCKKCQTLFFAKTNSGKCATDGGPHDSSESGVYSVAEA